MYFKRAIDTLADFSKGEYVFVGGKSYVISETAIALLSDSASVKRIRLEAPTRSLADDSFLAVPPGTLEIAE
ncbi:hypothetical protein [Rhizobium sp. RU20A]|uniref:hypothetical protein n=1 Tax=Rhizobium sp. RU20A TaxID=1907412 RepID=UPI00122C6A69|nr:hypothetical protein [Rhizobium sp. RU20A]